MEVPDLVERELGDEPVRSAVSLGDDVLCLTPRRAIVYRGEGLLSDESVTSLSLDVDRLTVSEGRRKVSFELTDIDGSDTFSVPKDRAERALSALLEGILRVKGIAEENESVRGVYRFSELTLIITDGRLVKLIGAAAWADDNEIFPFADVTGLEFEEGSVATQIVLEVDGRPQRMKAPNDEAPKLRQTLQRALFEYYDVDSIGEFNDAVRPAGDPSGASGDASETDELAFDDGIDPLVGEGASEAEPADEPADSFEWESPSGEAGTDDDQGGPPGEAVEEQLEILASTVERQNELIERQQRALERLVEELREHR
ncbi:MAG: hypothetical protein ABEH64_06175 [Salinirussus sp.]